MTKMNSFPDPQAQLHRGKHSNGRQIASSFCGNIVTADRILPQLEEALSRPTKYPMLRDGVLSRATEYLLRLRKHSNGRQSACYDCGNIPTADRVHDAAGWSTLTADRVPATTAEILSRPTECLLRSDGALSRPTECFRDWIKHSDGRQNA